MAYFPRVAADTEVAYELVAEPIQELQAGEQQEDAVEHAPEEIANPADLQGKPRSMTHKFSVYIYIYIIFVHLSSRSCMEP